MKEIIINILSKVYQSKYKVLRGETPSNKNSITPTKQKSNGGYIPTKQKFV